MDELFESTTFCPNDDVPCKCRSCKDSKLNDGTCSHCFTCIQGERSMDICDDYKE